MAAAQLVSELSEELSCPVCREGLREPRVLRCRHVACRVCLERWWHSRGRTSQISCPQCRAKTTFTFGKGVKDLPEPLLISSLQEKITRYVTSLGRDDVTTSRRCGSCDVHAGVQYCPTCTVYMCDVCATEHGTQDFTKHHVPFYLSRLTCCYQHGGEIFTFYCETCRTGACFFCIKDAKHRSHKVKDTLDPNFFLQRKDDLETLQKDMEVRASELTDYISKVNEVKLNLDDVRDVFVEWTEGLLGKISDAKQKADDNVEQELSSWRKNLQTLAAEAESLRAFAESLRDHVTQLLNRNSAFDIVLSEDPPELPVHEDLLTTSGSGADVLKAAAVTYLETLRMLIEEELAVVKDDAGINGDAADVEETDQDSVVQKFRKRKTRRLMQMYVDLLKDKRKDSDKSASS